jgi:poly(hydroxyalkanoate) granule-associated protein
MATRKKAPRREAARPSRANRLEQTWTEARKRALAGLAELQKRARRDGRSLSRGVDDAVARALAALNIPTRQEVQELSRQVARLSARVDRLRR